MTLNFVVLCLSCWLEVCETSLTNLKAWLTQNYRKKTRYMNMYVRDCQITSRLDFLPQKGIWKGSFQKMFWQNFGSFYPRTEYSSQTLEFDCTLGYSWIWTTLDQWESQIWICKQQIAAFALASSENTINIYLFIVICLNAAKARFNNSMMTYSGWRQFYPGLIVIQSNMYLKLSVLICHLVHLCSWFFKFSLSTLDAIF